MRVRTAALGSFMSANVPDRIAIALGSFSGIVAWAFVISTTTPVTGVK
jgi:hypothetical protein